jgi:hypothetical protein
MRESAVNRKKKKAVVAEEVVILPDTKEGRQRMSPEAKRKLSETLRRRFAEPELRERMRLASKAAWENPLLREKMKSLWTPERRQRQSEMMKEAFRRKTSDSG